MFSCPFTLEASALCCPVTRPRAAQVRKGLSPAVHVPVGKCSNQEWDVSLPQRARSDVHCVWGPIFLGTGSMVFIRISRGFVIPKGDGVTFESIKGLLALLPSLYHLGTLTPSECTSVVPPTSKDPSSVHVLLGCSACGPAHIPVPHVLSSLSLCLAPGWAELASVWAVWGKDAAAGRSPGVGNRLTTARSGSSGAEPAALSLEGSINFPAL